MTIFNYRSSKVLYKSLILCLVFFINAIGLSNNTETYLPAKNAIVSSNVYFNWKYSSSAINYRVQISKSPVFSIIITDTILNSNNFNKMFSTAGIYYWRYKIIGNGFVSDWSDISSFNVYDPKQTPGILLWLKADSGVISRNDSIIQWSDLSGNNNHAKQTVDIRRPSIIHNVSLLNNQSVVRLNNTDNVNNTSNQNVYFDLTTPISNIQNVFMVLKHQTGNQSYAAILGGTSTIDYVGEVGNDMFAYASTYVKNGKIYKNQQIINWAVIKKPTNYTLLSILQSGPTYTDHISSDRFYNGRYWNGDFAEIILYSGTLTDQDRIIIEEYFKSKFAPPIIIKDTIPVANFCDSIIISAPSRFVSYLWSTSETTQSIKVKASGTYSCKGVDIFNISSEDEISVFPYERLGNSTIYICSGQTYNLNLKTPPGFTALWNTGANTTNINITNAGRYIAKITDNRGCFIYDTINVIIDNPRLSVTPVAGNITACSGEKLFVQTESAFDSIRWSTGSTDNFISITNAGNYSVQAYTSAGCILNKSFNVNIAGFAPTANFSTSSVCQSTLTQLTDLSTPPSGSTITNWKWNFSNGNTSSGQSPSTTFNNLGTASAALKITTAQGCTDSIYKTFIVNKRPTPQFINRKSCEGNPTLFQDQSVANAASITNWKWDFNGLGTINDIQNPAFEFPTANTYNVKLIVTNSNGCVDSVTNSLKVNQSPIADFSFDAACGKSPINFRFLATVPVAPTPPQPFIANWNWDFGDNQTESAIKDVQHVYGTTGVYNVKLSVTSSEQCVDTIEKQVKVYDFPVVDFDVSATQCAGKEIQFTDVSQTPDGTPLTTWKWFFAGESTATTQNSAYTFNTEGNYIIQLNATNAIGCSGTKQRSIAVSAKPEIKFTFSPQNLPAPLDVTYTNQSPTSGNYIWDYGDNTSPLFSGYNPPVHRYLTDGNYPIKLIATNFRGCTDTLTKFILVGKANVDAVMTSISIIPNGDYYKIQVTILNASNIEIRDLGLSLQLGGGAVIRENWSGSLLPNQTTIYNFFGQIKISDNVIPVICASIDNVNNNTTETRIDNNTTCKEVKVGSFDILNVYPNPAFDVLNLGVMMPNDGKVQIRIVDALGQTFEKKEFNGIKGYNNFIMNTIQLNAAIYIAEVNYDGQVVRTKFMRNDRK